MDYRGKRALVCGLARSGAASALLLKQLGADVTAQDIKERDAVEEVAVRLEAAGVKLYLGKNPDDIIADFDIAIISPGIPCDLPFFDRAFSSLVPVWGEIELASSVCESPIIAITGTNGKTTTTALVGEIMEAFAPGSQTMGNIGVPFAERVLGMREDAWVVAEVSSFQLETAFTFHPRVSAVLNITPDHLVRHKSMDKYIEVKERVFARQREDDFLVLNYDDPICREMVGRTRARKLFFSRLTELGEGICVRDGAITVKWDGIDEVLLTLAELPIPGAHNVENIMAAAGIAICAGAGLPLIRRVIRGFNGVEHRIEYVRTLAGVDYYNDSKATNTDSAVKGLEAMDRPVLLIGGGQDKGVPFGDWVRLFEERVKRLVVIGETAEAIIETCKQYNFTHYERVNSLKDAVELCRAKAVAGDCVLLSPACASYDMFDNYEQRGRVFKEFVNGLS